MANFICIRDPLNSSMNGKWYDLDKLREGSFAAYNLTIESKEGDIIYIPIDEFEYGDDGSVAQIYVRKND